MVSNYSDAGQETLAGRQRHRPHPRQWPARRPGAVEVDGARHTAEHIVLASGADPVIPPIPGLRELDGIWTNREATAMKAVPRRLLVLGGGPVGVEMAQAVRRLGGEVALVEGAEHVLSREPAPLGEALGEILRRDGIELALGVHVRPRRAATVRNTSSHSTTAASCAATACSSPPAGGRASTGIGLETVGVEADPRGVPVDFAPAAPPSGCGRSATSRASSR